MRHRAPGARWEICGARMVVYLGVGTVVGAVIIMAGIVVVVGMVMGSVP